MNRYRAVFAWGLLFGITLMALYAPEIHAQTQETGTVPIVSGTTYYVSKTGNNRDGSSWDTAWNELDQIDWDVIRPGDRIFLDGGATEMVYQTTLEVKKSGTAQAPIRIEMATETGRNGKVVIFGGRDVPLPFCHQRNYDYKTDGVRSHGIYISDRAWIFIDGNKWRGITVYGHNGVGIRLRGDAHHITIRNAEVYDNGVASQDGDGWYSDLPGVSMDGHDLTFERMIVHDNGQDAFQSGGVERFTLRNAWLYNERVHPDNGEAFNYCRHTDGIQIYGGGEQSGLLIESSIIGPGFMQGVLLGGIRPDSGSGPWSVLHDVTIRNSLFYGSTNANISSHTNALKPRNWRLENVTSHRTEHGRWHNIYIEGSGHLIHNSVFHGSSITLPDGDHIFSGNCQEKTTGVSVGKVVSLGFVNEAGDDYSINNTDCTGASIASLAALLNINDVTDLSPRGESLYLPQIVR